MKINYTLPIIKADKAEILKVIKKNESGYQYFEVWLDYIDDLDQSFLDELLRNFAEKLIILFRRLNLEKIKTPLSQRLEIIKKLDNSQAILDLDFTQKKELDFLQKNNLNIKKIISYHNYKDTPEQEKLNEIIDTMNKYNPDIYKIATFCKNEKDALTLLNIQQNLKNKGLKYIVLGMGENGIITRIFGTLWGNEMIFAPINKSESSAPGQLTKEKVGKIFTLILDS